MRLLKAIRRTYHIHLRMIYSFFLPGYLFNLNVSLKLLKINYLSQKIPLAGGMERVNYMLNAKFISSRYKKTHKKSLYIGKKMCTYIVHIHQNVNEN